MSFVLRTMFNDARRLPELVPIFGITTFACTMGTAAIVRTLFTREDVCLDHRTTNYDRVHIPLVSQLENAAK
eukprot:m.9398 g.9398  ORF g.9398 m.9398 type:complete len:72 (+) comp7190_c0_seq1:574-789(+)